MGAVKNAVIHNLLISRAKALGNSHRGLKEVASDLINDFTGGDPKRLKDLVKSTYLSAPTLERLSSLTETETGEPYRPQVETIERVLRAFNAEVNFKEVKIKGQYQNQPKHELE